MKINLQDSFFDKLVWKKNRERGGEQQTKPEYKDRKDWSFRLPEAQQK